MCTLDKNVTRVEHGMLGLNAATALTAIATNPAFRVLTKQVLIEPVSQQAAKLGMDFYNSF